MTLFGNTLKARLKEKKKTEKLLEAQRHVVAPKIRLRRLGQDKRAVQVTVALTACLRKLGECTERQTRTTASTPEDEKVIEKALSLTDFEDNEVKAELVSSDEDRSRDGKGEFTFNFNNLATLALALQSKFNIKEITVILKGICDLLNLADSEGPDAASTPLEQVLPTQHQLPRGSSGGLGAALDMRNLSGDEPEVGVYPASGQKGGVGQLGEARGGGLPSDVQKYLMNLEIGNGSDESDAESDKQDKLLDGGYSDEDDIVKTFGYGGKQKKQAPWGWNETDKQREARPYKVVNGVCTELGPEVYDKRNPEKVPQKSRPKVSIAEDPKRVSNMPNAKSTGAIKRPSSRSSWRDDWEAEAYGPPEEREGYPDMKGYRRFTRENEGFPDMRGYRRYDQPSRGGGGNEPKLPLPLYKDAVNAREFMAAFQRRMKSYNTSEERGIEFFELALKGSEAETWLRQFMYERNYMVTWSNLKSQFLETFTNEFEVLDARAKMEERVMKPSETMRKYIMDKLYLIACYDMHMKELEKVEKVISGLPLNYQEKILASNYRTVKELQTGLVALDAAMRRHSRLTGNVTVKIAEPAVAALHEAEDPWAGMKEEITASVIGALSQMGFKTHRRKPEYKSRGRPRRRDQTPNRWSSRSGSSRASSRSSAGSRTGSSRGSSRDSQHGKKRDNGHKKYYKKEEKGKEGKKREEKKYKKESKNFKK